MGDWDLFAVVRGHSNNVESHQFSIFNSNIDKINSMELLSQSSNSFNTIFPNNLSFQDQDELFNAYPHLFETTTAFDELEELYKPFYPGPTTAPVFSSSSTSSLCSHSSSVAVLSNSHFDSQLALERRDSSSPKVKIAKEPASKYKKRKNQQKRVVKEVREDGLSLDMWAWRKYGQKPIKGSPYPRSYYRCSSSKGCSARKQVERSPSNPDTFIITYTAEHSHPHPTRRNSLAGSTRTKCPGPGPTVLNDNNNDHNNNNNNKDIDRDESTNTTTSSENINVDVKNVVLRHDHSYLFASLDDLERGLEVLIDHDEETTSNDHNINNNDYDHDNIDYKSELLLDGGFFGDYDHEVNWFVDQYNTTLTGAC